MTTPPELKRILVVKIADIGDLILTTPALAALRRTFPAAQIDLLTRSHAAPVLEHTGLVNQVIPFKIGAYERLRDLLQPAALREGLALVQALRGAHYDAVILFHQFSTRFGSLKNAAIVLATGAKYRCGLDNGRGWYLTHRAPDLGFGTKHQVEYWLEVAALVGAEPEAGEAGKRLRVGYGAADRAWAELALPDGVSYIAVHPGSGGLNTARRWDADKFAVVADALHKQRDAQIVIVGGKDDGAEDVIRLMQHQPINLAGKTTLNQLAAALARCQSYVGSDSGVMHIAGATPGLVVQALFGPTNHRAWGAWTAGSFEPDIIRSGALCSPCGYVGNSVGLRSGCAARTCMRLINPTNIPGVGDSKPKPHTEIQRQTPPALHVLGVPIDSLTFDDLLATIERWITERRAQKNTLSIMARQLCTANPELVMMAQRDSLFYNILQRCALVTSDGVGLIWAARRLGVTLPTRVTGSDGLPIIAERAAREGWRLFLLGAAPGVAAAAADVLRTRFPGVEIVGTYAGNPTPEDEDLIAARVNASGADILFVAYGSPAQEKWIARNLPRLQVAVVLGVGGAFDFVAGVTRRAPEWMRRAGIEWLHRLIQQPWRWRRMLRLPRFVFTVLRRRQRGPFRFEGKYQKDIKL